MLGLHLASPLSQWVSFLKLPVTFKQQFVFDQYHSFRAPKPNVALRFYNLDMREDTNNYAMWDKSHFPLLVTLITFVIK